jgi:hypothetical protein
MVGKSTKSVAIAAAMTLAVLGLPAAAAASSAAVSVGGVLTYAASAGETNNVTIAPSGLVHRVTDPGATITPGSDCFTVDAHTVDCGASILITSAVFNLDDMDDAATLNDSLPSTMNGETGNDTLAGGTGADVFNGGSETDTVTYVTRSGALNISIDGAANDGASEGDNVKTDVETVVGGAGNDTITGSAAGDTIDGRGGADILDASTGADVIHGGAGPDTIGSRDGTVDQIDCGPETDSVTGDAADAIAVDCEQVLVPSSGGGSGGGGGAGGGNGGGGGGGGANPAAKRTTMRIAIGKAALDIKGAFAIRLTCLGPIRCRGLAFAYTVKPVAEPARRAKRRLKLTSRRISVASGKRLTMKMQVSKRALKLFGVLDMKLVRVRVTASYLTSSGQRGYARRAFTLRTQIKR